jgi:hypothetical protein
VPSKRPAPSPTQDLDEVDRALSILGGRHPEHERAQRESREAARKRNLAVGAELAAQQRLRRRRLIVLAVNAVAVAAVALVALRLVVRARRVRARITRTETPWVGRGFVEVATNTMTAGLSLDLDLPGDSCFATVTDAAGAMVLRQDRATTDGVRSIAWCSCGPAHVTVQAPADAASGGFGVLRIAAGALGGPLARGWLDFAPGAWAAGGDECADAVLDAWIAGHGQPAVAPDKAWLEETRARASLVRDGFRAVPGVPASRPFGVVDGQASTCFLASSPSGEALSLRATGGARRAHGSGAMGWCTAASVTTSVWRDGHGPVAVVAAPAERLGGLLGLREAAAEAGIPLALDALWVDDADLGWNAAAMLRASGLSGTPRSLPPLAGPPDARIVALTLGASAEVAYDPASAVVACDPPLAAAATLRASVCATSVDVSWWRKTDGAAAEAPAGLPVWLAPLESHREPDAVARIPELLGLARGLVRAGFTPTVLEGVTELPDGVRIIGRAGEDAVVAVGVGQHPPWVFPYTSGVPWDLGDAPVVVPLEPGETVKLTTSPLPATPPDKRRTVVFRRAASP